jgi:hypothetical protein
MCSDHLGFFSHGDEDRQLLVWRLDTARSRIARHEFFQIRHLLLTRQHRDVPGQPGALIVFASELAFLAL